MYIHIHIDAYIYMVVPGATAMKGALQLLIRMSVRKVGCNP